jgi:dTDP-4-dehydrorhamnose reductase
VTVDRQTVLVTGASGVLGTWLRRTAPSQFDVVASVHRTPVSTDRTVELDLREPEGVVASFESVAPDLVIHAAYAPDEASIVDATAHIVGAAAGAGARVVFTSTDAVFAGDGVARTEGDRPDPEAEYGRYKAAAEALVREASPGSVVVRLPLVASLDPADAAVARIQAAAANGEVSRWFDDEIRQPAPAAELARAIWDIADLEPSAGAGVWHLPGAERISRYEIARRAAVAAALSPSCVAGEPTPGGTDRPRDLHLRGDRARRVLCWDPSPIFGGPLSPS